MKLSALVGLLLPRWRSICGLTSRPPARVSPIKTFSFSGVIRTEWKASLPPPFMTIIRGVATLRGIAATSAAVLTFLLLVTVVPAVTFLPSAAVVATGGEHGPPTSTVAPLPEYTTSQVVTISYTSFKHGQGSGGDDDDGGSSSAGGRSSSASQSDGGKTGFWAGLFYSTSNESPWALCMPPSDHDGRLVGGRGRH